MSREMKNSRIKKVKLDQIVQEEVIAFTVATAGAMGDPGAIEFFSIHEDQVLYFYGNYAYGDLDLDEVSDHLPDGIAFSERIGFVFENAKWSIFGGGMGNQFVIRSEHYPELEKRIQNYKSERNYYRNCIEVLKEYLLELANANKRPDYLAILADQELMSMFERVARENGRSAETVLSDFIKDYIVSGGHPEVIARQEQEE